MNLNFNFNHVKVFRCTKTVPHTLQQNQIPVIFPLFSLMFRYSNTGKNLPQMLLLTSAYLVISDIVVALLYIYIYFEVLHSGQHSSPLLRHRLMLLLHFKIESAGTKTPNSTLIPSERNRQRLHLTAGLANGTNLEL